MENTSIAKSPAILSEDHLHIRGEYFQTQNDENRNKQSPPHTWRILQAAADQQLKNKDHLHIRGEYQSTAGTASPT